SRPTSEVNAALNSQDASIEPGTYRYARVEMCKSYPGDAPPAIPTLMWKGPGMSAEQAFVSGDCGRTSLQFDPPLELAGHDEPSGAPHCFRTCVDTAPDHRVCMYFPALSPSATRL